MDTRTETLNCQGYYLRTMERRYFVKIVGEGTIAFSLLPMVSIPNVHQNNNVNQLIERLLKANDIRVSSRLASQILDVRNKWFGGSSNKFGIVNAASSCTLINDLTCAYISPGSTFHKEKKLLIAIRRATEYLLNSQYDDGTVDLHTTNFHSTPDTAFRVEPLALSYNLLKTIEPPQKEILTNLERFLRNAGKALSVGGIHTPNHRWVVCMALAHIHNLFPNQKYVQRIEQWLNEGIDIDPDGQYTEKSTTVYSPLVDRCLITIANLLDKPALLDPVRKNLDMTLYYVRPNYEVSTETSGRQDKYKVGTIAKYHYPYRYMAIKDGNGRYARIVNQIESSELPQIVGNLIYFLHDPFLQSELPITKNIETDYVRYFKHSKLVRIRRGDRDATIIAGNPVVFSYFKGSAVLTGLRLASAFFGKGQFEGDEIEIKDNEYTLKRSLTGPYYQPLGEGEFHPEIDSFSKQRETREKSEVQLLDAMIRLIENQGKFQIQIRLKGTDNVPVAVELGFREGGVLEGVRPIEDIADAYLLESGNGKYTHEEQTITFGPGIAEHQWTQLRGALPKLEGKSVYLTGYTPFILDLNIS
ncbi:MAG: hypothetical protein ACR2MX_11145 [Cyclobacteriaceae bacterium]